MESIFVRSLALAAGADAACVTSASRTPADGTFAVASRTEGVIQVYAASCAAVLHEFATIHPRVHALHYTSFSDSLITLESDRPAGVSTNGPPHNEDEATFLCVYHDWRERNMVRGYTLPLGVLDTPSSKRKADCVAVCSYTGRVVVAMESVLNIWQCSQGFFEHVMELTVDMTQHDAYHVLQYVAIHGVYVAFGSSTEVRVMEVHVRSTKEAPADAAKSAQQVSLSLSKGLPQRTARQDDAPNASNNLPDDDSSCVHFDTRGDVYAFDLVPIPLASYGGIPHESDYRDMQEKSMHMDQEELPIIFDKDEAQQEAFNLAGLIKNQYVRVNQAMSYYVAENDVRIILRRYLPPNQRIQTLKFLPETIDNHVSVEARSYTRLLVGTADHAFLYYFLSTEADVTRKKMAKKVLGKKAIGRMPNGTRDTSFTTPQLSPTNSLFDDDGRDNGLFDPPPSTAAEVESTRVVMHYAFASPASCITANSSFLFVTSSSSLQVWSIWSPCLHLASTRTVSTVAHQEPTQPQLLSVHPLPHSVCDIAALDSYVILLPRQPGTISVDQKDRIRVGSAAALELLPSSELELRGGGGHGGTSQFPSMLIFQQSPPSAIFAMVQTGHAMRSQTRVDLLLSLFSLYRYRADVGTTVLVEESESLHGGKAQLDARETMALQLETTLYNRLACACAASLAATFMDQQMRDLSRAVLFLVASNMSPAKVMRTFQELIQKEPESRVGVVQATHDYLASCVFQKATGGGNTRPLSTRRDRSETRTTTTTNFTMLVVSHYTEHAPDQLTRLVIDSSLVWTLADLHATYGMLTKPTTSPTANATHDSSLVNIAKLVLILRAQSLLTQGTSEDRKQNPAVYSAMEAICSYDALCASVDTVVRDDTKAFVRLCVSHPDLLVCSTRSRKTEKKVITTTTASLLSQALLDRAPDVMIGVLQAVFDSAIGRRVSVRGSVVLCAKAIGGAATAIVHRMETRRHGLTTEQQHTTVPCITDMSTGHCILIRLLCFVLDAFPRLLALAEKDEINEDEEELLAVRRVVAMEFLHLCVQLTSVVGQNEPPGQRLCEELVRFIPPSSCVADAADRIGLPPAWELDYLESRCVPSALQVDSASVVRHLLQRALSLVHETNLILASELLAVYEPATVNDFGFLLVLLTLPRMCRTVDGLRLLAERHGGYVELFLPYGKCYCDTLEEWKFLIETLSILSENSNEAPPASGSAPTQDELGVLESVLNHVCSTLGPEDLLLVLPDDGDLALFMATIEASVRLEDARLAQEQARAWQLVAH